MNSQRSLTFFLQQVYSSMFTILVCIAYVISYAAAACLSLCASWYTNASVVMISSTKGSPSGYILSVGGSLAGNKFIKPHHTLQLLGLPLRARTNMTWKSLCLQMVWHAYSHLHAHLATRLSSFHSYIRPSTAANFIDLFVYWPQLKVMA